MSAWTHERMDPNGSWRLHNVSSYSVTDPCLYEMTSLTEFWIILWYSHWVAHTVEVLKQDLDPV